MKVISNPSRCLGGESCGGQPEVSILDNSGSISLNFVGTMYAQMYSSPTGLESLYVGDCDINNNCGTQISGASSTSARVAFVNGIASFQVFQ
jgi:hypothetical protein